MMLLETFYKKKKYEISQFLGNTVRLTNVISMAKDYNLI